MKKVGLFAAVALGLLALPGAGVANQGCNNGTVYTSGGGLSGTAETVVGVCVNTGTGPFYGGTAEIGTGSRGTYGVIDGDERNALAPAGNDKGYAALSTYETGGKDTSCDGTDAGSGTNSGGCLWIKTLGVGAPVPLIACGSSSGPQFQAAGRDGCSIP